jgi:hypothetical protein
MLVYAVGMWNHFARMRPVGPGDRAGRDVPVVTWLGDEVAAVAMCCPNCGRRPQTIRVEGPGNPGLDAVWA